MAKKKSMTPHDLVEAGHIVKVYGTFGISNHVTGSLHATIEQVIKQAISDLPDATTEAIVTEVMKGIQQFHRTTRGDNLQSYIEQFRQDG